jgi:hypothetical protein
MEHLNFHLNYLFVLVFTFAMFVWMFYIGVSCNLRNMKFDCLHLSRYVAMMRDAS